MEITPEIISDFRATYPLFADVPTWPDEVVEDALCQGDMATQCAHWGTFILGDCSSRKRRGMYLYAAHILVSIYPNGATDPGDMSPYQRSRVQSKTVGDESLSYALSTALNSGDEWLGSTVP